MCTPTNEAEIYRQHTSKVSTCSCDEAVLFFPGLFSFFFHLLCCKGSSFGVGVLKLSFGVGFSVNRVYGI